MAGTDRSQHPTGPRTWTTAPVILVMAAGVLSIFSDILPTLLDRLGPIGQFFGHHFLLTSVLALGMVAGGLWFAARQRKMKRQRPRSKVIPFPEHRRRRGA